MRNPFESLRYEDKNSFDPYMSQRQMAEKLGYKPNTVRKAESEGWEHISTGVIKAYHDKMNVSYEYLFGETDAKEMKYYKIGQLFPFDDSFYKHLRQLLNLDGKGNDFTELMLSALLHDPQALHNALSVIFRTLYKINIIQQDKTLTDTERVEIIKMQEYIFNQSTIEFLEQNIMPLLKRAFESWNERLAMESEDTQKMLEDLDDSIQLDISNLIIEPIE